MLFTGSAGLAAVGHVVSALPSVTGSKDAGSSATFLAALRAGTVKRTGGAVLAVLSFAQPVSAAFTTVVGAGMAGLGLVTHPIPTAGDVLAFACLAFMERFTGTATAPATIVSTFPFDATCESAGASLTGFAANGAGAIIWTGVAVLAQCYFANRITATKATVYGTDSAILVSVTGTVPTPRNVDT